jgi:UDP-N-acetylmuramyl tripeptide synthase
MLGRMALPVRTRLAVVAGRAVSEVSRRAGTGQGSAVGGRVTLALDPRALELLAAGHRAVLVSGTNGKTTTTRLVAAALATAGKVTTNSAGANLLSGLVGTLSGSGGAALGAFEVDEGLVPAVVAAVRPEAVVLLNLSRDQLDRIGEVRLHAEAWRRALVGAPGPAVVANADDPLVAWAAAGEGAGPITWVGTGQRWRSDAATCPACGGQIRWEADWDRGGSTWSCSSCRFARPEPSVWLDGHHVVLAEGERLDLDLQLPGWANLANATMATAGAKALGVPPAAAVEAMAGVGTVAGRYQVVEVGGAKVRLLLAKNPAGWSETLDLIRPVPLPVIVGINAEVADGRDPSWLWDVPFERLRGRLVIATGERGRDLAVRLRYAEVEHRFVAGYLDAVRAAGGPDIDLAANYTSFQDARKALLRGRPEPAEPAAAAARARAGTRTRPEA